MVMQLQLQTQPQTQTQTYADKVNSQFHKSKSHYVSLPRRLRDSVQDPWHKSILASAESEFRNSNPNIKSWNDFRLCRSIPVALDLIEIDTTLQRMLNLTHVCNILRDFRSIQVMPICVYEDAINPGKYICWDGQHTAIMLSIIASRILGKNLSECEVPVVIYSGDPTHGKREMRRNFIVLNGIGKLPVDLIDIFHQKVFAVRTDGDTDPDFLLNERKQVALENSKMFATNTKFGDTSKPGALTVLTELTNTRYSLRITENFCKYFAYVCQSSRPVAPKESWMMYEYFRLCEDSGIIVDDNYILGIANSLKIHNKDFDADECYDRARASWQNWYRNNKRDVDGTILGISYPEKRIGVTFLLEQIRKRFDGDVPELNTPLWDVPEEDLF